MKLSVAFRTGLLASPTGIPLTFLVVASFIIGFAGSAVAAGSHLGPWAKIFGHSTSCALGVASLNDSTHKAGARTSNFRGCSAANAPRTVPPYYLGARSFIIRNANGAICGTSVVKWNTSTASTVTATSRRTSYANGCNAPDYYFGLAYNYRKSDAGNLYSRTDRTSDAAYYLDSWLI